MTAPIYPFCQVLYSPAEYLTSEDLTLMQKIERAGMLDFIVGARIRSDELSTRYPQGYVYAYGGGAPIPSATVRTVTNQEGLIFVDSPSGGAYSTGEDNSLKPYWLTADELSTQLSVGHATLPRIDLISIGLAYVDNDAVDDEVRFAEATPGVITGATFAKRRKVVLTKTVTEGNPDPSPTVPATPAGSRRWAAVYVPATANAVIDHAYVYDMRRPAGLDASLTYCSGIGPHVHTQGATAWTEAAVGRMEAAASGKILTVFPHLRARHNARLIGVRVIGDFNDATCTFELVRRTLSTGSDTVVGTLSHGVISPSQLFTLSDDAPLWGSGMPGGPASYVNGAGHNYLLGLKFTTTTATAVVVSAVEWLFAAM